MPTTFTPELWDPGTLVSYLDSKRHGEHLKVGKARSLGRRDQPFLATSQRPLNTNRMYQPRANSKEVPVFNCGFCYTYFCTEISHLLYSSRTGGFGILFFYPHSQGSTPSSSCCFSLERQSYAGGEERRGVKHAP